MQLISVLTIHLCTAIARTAFMASRTVIAPARAGVQMHLHDRTAQFTAAGHTALVRQRIPLVGDVPSPCTLRVARTGLARVAQALSNDVGTLNVSVPGTADADLHIHAPDLAIRFVVPLMEECFLDITDLLLGTTTTTHAVIETTLLNVAVRQATHQKRTW